MLRRGRCFALCVRASTPSSTSISATVPRFFFLYITHCGASETKTLIMKKSLFSACVVGLGLTASIFGQVPNYVPTNGLVGYWPFNGNANDASGNGNNGTVNGATLTADRFGISNMAYSFDGINDYISTDRSGYTTFSISLWCKLPSPAMPVNPLVDGFESYYDIYFTQSKLYYATFTSLNQYTNIDCIVTPSIGQWQHLVFVYSNNSISVYSNSSLAGTYNVQPLSGTAGNHNFGASLTGTDQYLNGCLDDIGIWNRALTQQEITNLYNGCASSTITSQPTNQTVNPTTSAQFVVNATSGSSFQWQTDLGFGFQNLSNAGQYSGANNDTLVVSNASISNNNQQFRCIVNNAGCADTSDIAVLTVSTVGMDELSVQGNVSLYPNPTQSSFEIQTNLVYSKIEIRDIQGRIVKTENAAKTINMASLQKGTYLVKLIDEKSKIIAVQRIIKE